MQPGSVNASLDERSVSFITPVSEVLNRNNMHWNSPASEWIDGAPLGNGDMGAMLYGPKESMCFALSKADLWNLEYNKDRSGLNFTKLKQILESKNIREYNKLKNYYLGLNPRNFPCPQPAGMLKISLCEGATAGYYSHDLDLYTGTSLQRFSPLGDSVTTGEDASPDVLFKVISFIHSTSNVLVIRVEPRNVIKNNVGPFRISLSRQLNGEVKQVPEYTTLKHMGLLNYGLPKGAAYTVACKVVGAKVKWSQRALSLDGICQPEFDGPVTIYCVMVTSTEHSRPQRRAVELVSDCVNSGFKRLKSSHEKWWAQNWTKSHVEFPNYPQIERDYYRGVYILSSCSRATKTLPGLQGVWVVQNASPWNGDYHGDINVQCPFWQVFASNRLELAEPYFAHYLRTLPQQKAWTKKFYNLPGVKFTMAGDLLGREIWGYITTSLWPVCSAWIAQNYIRYWQFSRDKQFLKQVAWPVLLESAKFLKSYMQKGTDGKWHISPTSMPELWFNNFEAWGSDCALDLTLISELFSAVIEASRQLKIEHELCCELEEILDELVSYPIDKNGNIQVLAEKSYQHPYLYTTFMLYPSNLPELLKNKKLGSVIKKTFDKVKRNDSWNFSCWACIVAGQAARLGDHETAWKIFSSWGTKSDRVVSAERWINEYNGLVNLKGKSIMQIDGTTALPAAINETLLQSTEGIIKIFPAVSQDFSGSFHSLRTENGFLVSAEMRSGKIKRVAIKSLFGETCRLEVGHWAKVSIKRVDSKSKVDYKLSQRVLSFDSQRNAIYYLERLGS